MTEDLRPPYRIAFDNARNPYAARNALGISSTGGGGAPVGAEYITAATDATLTNERVLTNTATITWDFSTPGQAKASTAAGGGNVSNSGTPTVGQYAKWVTATTIQGVSAATVLGDIGAQPAGSYQPLDGDLTAIAALAGTNTIYYRSAADTWSPVTVSTGLSFTGGALTCTVSSGAPGGSNTQVQFNDSGVFGGDADLTWNKTTNVLTVTGQIIQLTAALGIQANGIIETAGGFRSTGFPAIFGTSGAGGFIVLRPNGNADSTGQLSVSSAGTVTVNGTLELGGGTDTTLSRVSAGVVAIEGQNILTAATGQPLDADLTAIAALTGTNTIYYRSAANTWSAVNVSTGLSFSGGNLTATGGGGDVFLAASNPFTGALNTFVGADVVFGHTAALDAANKIEVHGTDTAVGIAVEQWSNDASLPHLHFRKSRGATPGTHSLVSAGDTLGQINLGGSDGSTFLGAATIQAVIDGTPSAGVMPGMLQFATRGTSGGNTERVRIDNAGALTVGLTTQYAKFGSTGANVLGTTTNDSAATGYVGEYVSSKIASASAVALATTVAKNVTSISLTAGDWDVAINGYVIGATTTNVTSAIVSVSVVSATHDVLTDRLGIVQLPGGGMVNPSGGWSVAVPMARVSLASTTTVYFVASATFTVSTLSAYGAITARRVR